MLRNFEIMPFGLMLILVLTLTGLLLGLIFSKKGNEKEAMISGAKKGASCGCTILILIAGVVVFIALVLATSM